MRAPLLLRLVPVVLAAAPLFADVDLELSLAPASSRVTVNVRNNGPANATQVRLCTAEPHSVAPFCRDPFDLAAGATRSFEMDMPHGMLSAKVTQLETDTNPGNSAIVWRMANSTSGFDLIAQPATARAGETGTLFLVPFFPVDVDLVSSDRNVLTIAARATVTPAEPWSTISFRALRPGTATIFAMSSAGNPAEITVHVVAADQPRRLSPIFEFSPEQLAWTFGARNALSIHLLGMTADGAQPTGTITFYDGGTPLGTATLIGGRATVNASNLRPGSHTLSAIYNGDAQFLPGFTSNHTVQVARGIPTITATANGSDVVIALQGVAGFTPTGIVAADEGPDVRNVSGPLAALNDTTSTVTAGGFSANARTVKVTYFGDANYASTVVSINIARPKRRAAGHSQG